MKVLRRHVTAHLAALCACTLLVMAGCRSSDEWQEPEVVEEEEDAAVEEPVVPPPPGKESGVQPKRDAGVQPKKDGAVLPPKKDAAVQPPKSDGPLPPKPDTAVPKPDSAKPKPDTTAWPAIIPGKVAAIQYGQGQAALHSATSPCTTDPHPDICALELLIIEARKNGASLIVAPEFYVLKQVPFAPDPTVGTNPAATPNWPDDNLLYLSQFTKQLGVYLVYDLVTYTGTEGQPGYQEYNTQIAFAPDGKIVAKHHKFNLFGSEPTWLTAGNSVTYFNTPLGKVGLLICADIYGSTTLLNQLAYTDKARVVAISSFWTTSSPGSSYYGPYAKKYGVYAVVANTTNSPGYGGGVYGPSGLALQEHKLASPKIVYYTFPQLPVP